MIVPDLGIPSPQGKDYTLIGTAALYRKRTACQQMTSWVLMHHLLRANYDAVGSEYHNTVEPSETSSNEGARSHEHGRNVESMEEIEDNTISISWSNTRINTDKNASLEGKIQADLVLATDSPSSTTRSLLPSTTNASHLPSRTYAGYVAFRDTAPGSKFTILTSYDSQGRSNGAAWRWDSTVSSVCILCSLD
jgi:hypothetical protein